MGKGILHAHAVFIIKAENLIVGIACIRHLLRAALAHADAVTVAPDRQQKIAILLADRPQLVFRAVDGQAQSPFQLAENIERQRHGLRLAVHQRRHIKIQFGIQAAGRRVFGRMGRNRVDAQNGAVCAAPLRCGTRLQQVFQRLILGCMRKIRINRQFARAAVGIQAVKRVVLDGEIVHTGGTPGVPRRFRLAAVGGRVVSARQATIVHQHNALCFVHSPCGAVVGGRATVVDLICRGVHQIIAFGRIGIHGTQRVGARRHGLCLQRLQRRGGTHLIRHNAIKIIFQIHMHDHIQRIRPVFILRQELQIARIDIARTACLRNFHATDSTGLSATEEHFLPHRIALPLMRQGQRARCGGKRHLHAVAV